MRFKIIILFLVLVKINQIIMSKLSLSYSNSQETYIKDGWFSEIEAMWPGQKFSIEVDEVLANGKSKFQVSTSKPSCIDLNNFTI